MIWLIGARWKCGNIWSRSVLIEALPFYVSTYCFYACINTISRVDLASNWCSSTTSIKISCILHRDKILKQNHWICGSPLVSFLGVHSAREIPVLIPNTEVKPGSGDYTALRETSKMPNYTNRPPQRVAFCLACKNKRPSEWGGMKLCFINCEAITCLYNDRALQPREHYIAISSHPNRWHFLFNLA